MSTDAMRPPMWEMQEGSAACVERSAPLSAAEWAALAVTVNEHRRPPAVSHMLSRLLVPLEAVLGETGAGIGQRNRVIAALLATMHQTQTPPWHWGRADWVSALQRCRNDARQHLAIVGYRLGGVRDLHREIAGCRLFALACRLFGAEVMTASLAAVRVEVCDWGYREGGTARYLHHAFALVALASGSAQLRDLTAEAFAEVRQQPMSVATGCALTVLGRALVSRGVLSAVPVIAPAAPVHEAVEGIPACWLAWCRRWQAHTVLAPQTRRGYWHSLCIVGRWIGQCRPDLADPCDWTREAAAAFVAAVDQMTVGQWALPQVRRSCAARLGQPLAPNSKDRLLRCLSAFFRDCQRWEWLSPRFDPRSAFRTPRHVRAAIGPRPQTIAQDLWGKLLWAGLNLTHDDLAMTGGTYHRYPLALVQAIAVTWLFAGLRADELCRLPVGCIRWQHDEMGIDGETPGQSNTICFLDVPANKTSAAFTKPVDRPVGEAIMAWEAIRPPQPLLLDRKTHRPTAYLFAYRGRRIGNTYLNAALIPLLCRKAGVPTHDARGNITSHRARSTIASLLFNAKHPLSLLELKEWLGHRYLTTTQHYVEITPTRQARALQRADYFGRVLRTVEVLIDKAAVQNGSAAEGMPWMFYDLGHGYCTHPYFSQCPHRLVCARCAFYRPKPEMEARLREARGQLVRLQQELPLTEEERAVIEEDLGGYEQLIARLNTVPALDGMTPQQRQGREGSELRP